MKQLPGLTLRESVCKSFTSFTGVPATEIFFTLYNICCNNAINSIEDLLIALYENLRFVPMIDKLLSLFLSLLLLILYFLINTLRLLNRARLHPALYLVGLLHYILN